MKTPVKYDFYCFIFLKIAWAFGFNGSFYNHFSKSGPFPVLLLPVRPEEIINVWNKICLCSYMNLKKKKKITTFW